MMVGQSLILGLGSLLDRGKSEGEIFSTFEQIPYVAVQISSSIEAEFTRPIPFLGQQHSLDISRSQLKHILPMLSAKHLESDNVFADYTVSRRYARVLFAHEQETIWQHVEASVAAEAVEPSKVVMLINMGDSFANAVWLDCLLGLQQRYPLAQYYPVFLFPESKDLDDKRTATIGAAVAELHQLSLGQFVPQNLETGRQHVIDRPLWTVANLQQMPLQKSNLVYWSMVRAVLNIAQVKHPAYGTLNQSFHDEYAKVFNRKADALPLIPRFATTFRAGLDMDRVELLQYLQQHCQAQTLTALLHHAPMSEVWNMARLQQLGCVLSTEALGLTEDLLTDTDAASALYASWQQYVLDLLFTDAIYSDVNPSPLPQIAQSLEQFWQQAVAAMPAEALLTDLAQKQVQSVTQQLWGSWQQGQISLAGLNEVLATLLQHDAQRQHSLKNLQERLRQSQQELAADLSAWQLQGEHADSVWWRSDTPVAVVAAKMAHAWAQKVHQQQVEAAIEVLTLVQTPLRLWQQSLDTVLQYCEAQSSALSANSVGTWFKKVSGSMNCQLLLQPNEHSMQVIEDLIAPHRQALLEQWQQHTAADAADGLADLLQYAQAHMADTQAWSSLLNAEVMSQTQVVQQILRQRILDLDATKIQQLAEISLVDIDRKLHFFIQPLGEVLTKKYREQTSTCLVCDEDLREHDVVSVMMNLCHSKDLKNGSVVSHGHCLGAEFLYTNSCYLDEWFASQLFIKAYRQYSQNEESMLHLHIDGNVDSIMNWRQNSVVRNRELIRQHLLLAYVAGNLVPAMGSYRLNLYEGALFFKLKSLAELVEHITLHDAQTLVSSNDRLRHVFAQDAETMQLNLRMALEQIKLEILPENVALEDADWHDAGRYVAWSRAARQLSKQWLQAVRKAA